MPTEESLWKIPRDTEAHRIREHGDAARTWIAGIHGIIETMRFRYGFEYDTSRPISQGFSSLLFPVTRNGLPAVLKIIPPWLHAEAEIRAMEEWTAAGLSPRVLGSDAGCGALLLTRVFPGEKLGDSGDSADGGEISRLISRLNIPSPQIRHPEAFPGLEAVIDRRVRRELSQAKEENRQFVPLFERALDQVRLDIAATDPVDLVLLHGDAHPQNFLRGLDGIYVIDPEPVIGDRHYDIANYAVVSKDGRDADALLGEMCDLLYLDLCRARKFAAIVAATEMLGVEPDIACRLSRIVEAGLAETVSCRAVSGVPRRTVAAY